jgi:CheY-like chemotaxis protein
MHIWKVIMTVSHRRKFAKQTLLVVNNDVNALVLMKGLLQNDYRVLLATDAERALRLFTIDGVRIDLAVIDRNVRSSRRGGLRRQMTEILPQLRILSMAGPVEDGVIRLQAFGASSGLSSDSLVQKIRIALTTDESGHKEVSGRVPRNHVSREAQVTPEVANVATKMVMSAGHA